MMDSTRYLSDRGISQAIDAGLIVFDPPLQDEQLQPMSVDWYVSSIEEQWSFANYPLKRDYVIPRCSEETLVSTQLLHFDKLLKMLITSNELRSSLRRLGCYARTGATMLGAGSCFTLEMCNPGPIDIILRENDKVAQMFFNIIMPYDVSMHRAEMEEHKALSDIYDQLMDMDYGETVKDPLNFIKKDFLEIKRPEKKLPKFEEQYLCVHAGKTARVLRKEFVVDFRARENIEDEFETVALPYLLMPGELVMVDTEEEIALSQNVGIRFYDNLIGTSRSMLNGVTRNRFLADVKFSCIPDGLVDPGYVGHFTRQPRTNLASGVTISEGDVLGHGVVIYFPKGVMRPYGSKGLNSHYYDTKDCLIHKMGKLR